MVLWFSELTTNPLNRLAESLTTKGGIFLGVVELSPFEFDKPSGVASHTLLEPTP
jgi:hypothetical protein